MILNEATIKYAGYDPRELSKGSEKRVCIVCDVCGRVRWVVFSSRSALCKSCVRIGMSFTEEHKHNLVNGAKGRKMPPVSDEARANMSKVGKGKKKPPFTDEHRQHMSATKQGIPYEEWTGFTINGEYCELFDDACRERIRVKYGHRCYICDKPQEDNVGKNGKVRKLSVHHIDSNKNQGCDGVLWKLIPVCMHCHSGSHYDPVKSRLEYLLNDEDV